MNISVRISKLERSRAERCCTACATERVVVVPDMAAARDPRPRRCERCGRDTSDRTKVLVGDAWSNV